MMARNDPKLHMITENNGGIILGYKSRGKILLQYMWCLDLFFFSLFTARTEKHDCVCCSLSRVSFQRKGRQKSEEFLTQYHTSFFVCSLFPHYLKFTRE